MLPHKQLLEITKRNSLLEELSPLVSPLLFPSYPTTLTQEKKEKLS